MRHNYPIAYACYNKDEKIRYESTSGGVFSLVAEYILEQMSGVVYGAAFDQDFKVKHIRIEDSGEIRMLRGSKYVQSDIGFSYREVQADLEEKRVVLFTGTPCQIYGLKTYLGKEYDNLYCMDFVCHGVASVKVWEAYVDRLKEKGEIEQIIFKKKVKGWKKWYFCIKYKDSVCQVRGALNTYMRSYLSYCNIRPSCYSCMFKGIERVSDFTIADCWGIAETNKEINDDKGLSALLIQNERARKIFELISGKLCYLEYEPEVLMEGNWTTVKSVKPHALRTSFFELVRTKGANYALDKHFRPTWRSWLKYRILCILGKEK